MLIFVFMGALCRVAWIWFTADPVQVTHQQRKSASYNPHCEWPKLPLLIWNVFNVLKKKRAWQTCCDRRYGLPVNFQAMLLQPNKKNMKKLREVLYDLYKHLDSSAAIIDVSLKLLEGIRLGNIFVLILSQAFLIVLP